LDLRRRRSLAVHWQSGKSGADGETLCYGPSLTPQPC
jgi:hypothetical protein